MQLSAWAPASCKHKWQLNVILDKKNNVSAVSATSLYTLCLFLSDNLQ